MNVTNSISPKVIDAFLTDLITQTGATLTVQFDGLPTKFMYSGRIDGPDGSDPVSLGDLTLVASNMNQTEASDAPAVSVELNLDRAEDLTIKRKGSSFSLRWSGGGLRLQLDVDIDTGT